MPLVTLEQLRERLGRAGVRDGPLPQEATAPAHPQETLDLACSRCGYLLRGLALAGDCPECGHSIEAAFASRSHAVRRWAGAVAAGAYALVLLHVAFVAWYLY